MLEAMIFDFDGVVVDSEPIHLDGFRRVLRSAHGVEFTDRQYYQRYISYCDTEAFAQMVRDFDLPCDAADVARLCEQKTLLVKRMLTEKAEMLPGVEALMRSARAAGLAVAVCSSALREEIELPLRSADVLSIVQVIVADEDVTAGKPDPAGYNLTRRLLNGRLGREVPASACLAVEDSPGGIAAAKAAGMVVLAVTNSVPAGRLSRADRIVDSLAEVTLESLHRMAGA